MKCKNCPDEVVFVAQPGDAEPGWYHYHTAVDGVVLGGMQHYRSELHLKHCAKPYVSFVAEPLYEEEECELA